MKSALDSRHFESKKRAQIINIRLDELRTKTFVELSDDDKTFLLRQLLENSQLIKAES